MNINYIGVLVAVSAVITVIGLLIEPEGYIQKIGIIGLFISLGFWLKTEISFFGQQVTVVCDLKCEKAWGSNSRPKLQLSDNIDDYVWLTDGELGEAPENPGTYEGGQGKPFHPDKHNKWCVRECERSETFERGQKIMLKDFTVRIYNIPSRHGGEKKLD